MHYLSPTGCTFWGNERWSRKQRIVILCLIPTSPIIVVLLSLLFIPISIFGIPYYVRKTLKAKETNLKLKLNNNNIHYQIIYYSCFITSILISPVLGIVISILSLPIVAVLVFFLIPIDFYRTQIRGASSYTMDEDVEEGKSLNSSQTIIYNEIEGLPKKWDNDIESGSGRNDQIVSVNDVKLDN